MNKLCKFKTEMYDELLDGRKVVWVANILGLNDATVSLILNGHKICKKVVAMAIVGACTNTQNVLQDVYKYFDKVDEGER